MMVFAELPPEIRAVADVRAALLRAAANHPWAAALAPDA